MSTSLPLAVSGEVITSAWGNQVRTELSSADDRLDLVDLYLSAASAVNIRVAAAGPYDSSGTGVIDWVPLGSVTVPGWAKRAAVTTSVNGAVATVAGIICLVNVAIGTVAGGQSGRFDFPTPPLRQNATWTDVLTLNSTGVLPVKTQISRTAGTGGSGRADSGTVTTVLIRFLPN